MTNHANKIKTILLDTINQMGSYSWIFTKNPEKYFTRNRKLDFKTMLTLLLSMDGNSIYKELLDTVVTTQI